MLIVVHKTMIHLLVLSKFSGTSYTHSHWNILKETATIKGKLKFRNYKVIRGNFQRGNNQFEEHEKSYQKTICQKIIDS